MSDNLIKYDYDFCAIPHYAHSFHFIGYKTVLRDKGIRMNNLNFRIK